MGEDLHSLMTKHVRLQSVLADLEYNEKEGVISHRIDQLEANKPTECHMLVGDVKAIWWLLEIADEVQSVKILALIDRGMRALGSSCDGRGAEYQRQLLQHVRLIRTDLLSPAMVEKLSAFRATWAKASESGEVKRGARGSSGDPATAPRDHGVTVS